MTTQATPLARLNELFEETGFFGERTRTFTPLDIVETSGTYRISLDVPGVDPADVQVEYKEGRLWISGERRPDVLEEGEKRHRGERPHGRFRRVVALPEDVATDQIDASYAAGVLSVVVPKAEAALPQKITVRVE
ncbi:MAG: Hsp20/alpha crystallin family protein [Pirellulaceae bacterium]|nr:Hsp20/alpha crystallin family protein [Pirellulaceae bacterium]